MLQRGYSNGCVVESSNKEVNKNKQYYVDELNDIIRGTLMKSITDDVAMLLESDVSLTEGKQNMAENTLSGDPSNTYTMLYIIMIMIVEDNKVKGVKEDIESYDIKRLMLIQFLIRKYNLDVDKYKELIDMSKVIDDSNYERFKPFIHLLLNGEMNLDSVTDERATMLARKLVGKTADQHLQLVEWFKGNYGSNTLPKHKCNINIQDDDGKTPIMYAIERGQEKFANLLLENGADLYVIKNRDGKTAFDLIINSSDNKIKSLLNTISDKVNKIEESSLQHLLDAEYTTNKKETKKFSELFNLESTIELRYAIKNVISNALDKSKPEDYQKIILDFMKIAINNYDTNKEQSKKIIDFISKETIKTNNQYVSFNPKTTDIYGDNAISYAKRKGKDDLVKYLEGKGFTDPSQKPLFELLQDEKQKQTQVFEETSLKTDILDNNQANDQDIDSTHIDNTDIRSTQLEINSEINTVENWMKTDKPSMLQSV